MTVQTNKKVLALNVLMIASENDALPNGKVGGIGDVIRDIPKFLGKQNVHVDVIVPGYQWHSKVNPCELVYSLQVPFRHEIKNVDLYKVNIQSEDNVEQWVLEHPDFCVGKPGQIYFDDGPEKPFYSDANKFALFCASVCELVSTLWFDKIDVMHLHDWHSAFIEILRAYDPKYQQLNSKKTVYSIHNLAIQGIRPITGDDSSLRAWFPHLQFEEQVINDPRYLNCINPTRAAINLADAVHVVSPTYKQEIMRCSDHSNGFIGGEGLQNDLIKANTEQRLFGFINGCDYDTKPPQPVSYQELLQNIYQTIEGLHGDERHIQSVHHIAQLRSQQWLQSKDKGPLLISIGRLTEQKVKLLLLDSEQGYVLDDVLNKIAEFSGRLIILGSGDPNIEDTLTKVMKRRQNLLFINGYCDNLSQSLYVNGDLFLMPSSFEPCGISQMLAMRAGQPCIAHKIGGLNDTISHLENGFLFAGDSLVEQTRNLIHALEQALTLMSKQPTSFNSIKQAAKKQRFLWDESINCYIKHLYCPTKQQRHNYHNKP